MPVGKYRDLDDVGAAGVEGTATLPASVERIVIDIASTLQTINGEPL